jgi:hypothetical protein
VIFTALRELAKAGLQGIVENVVLLGLPVIYREEEWVEIRAVASGKIIVGYSEKDWVLGFLFRSCCASASSIVGISGVPNSLITSVDLSQIISGHTDYFSMLGLVLGAINL